MSKDGESEVRGDEPPAKRARTEGEPGLAVAAPSCQGLGALELLTLFAASGAESAVFGGEVSQDIQAGERREALERLVRTEAHSANPGQLTPQQQDVDYRERFKARKELHETVEMVLNGCLGYQELERECGILWDYTGNSLTRCERGFIRRNKEGNTPLIVALRSVCTNPEVRVKVVETLLRHPTCYRQLTTPDKFEQYPYQIVEGMANQEMNRCLERPVTRIFDGFSEVCKVGMSKIMDPTIGEHRKTLRDLCRQLKSLLTEYPELFTGNSRAVQGKIDEILNEYLKALLVQSPETRKTPDQFIGSCKNAQKSGGDHSNVISSVQAFLGFFDTIVNGNFVTTRPPTREEQEALAFYSQRRMGIRKQRISSWRQEMNALQGCVAQPRARVFVPIQPAPTASPKPFAERPPCHLTAPGVSLGSSGLSLASLTVSAASAASAVSVVSTVAAPQSLPTALPADSVPAAKASTAHPQEGLREPLEVDFEDISQWFAPGDSYVSRLLDKASYEPGMGRGGSMDLF